MLKDSNDFHHFCNPVWNQRSLECEKQNIGLKGVKPTTIAVVSALCGVFLFWNVLCILSGNLTTDDIKLLLAQFVPSKIGKQFHSTMTRGQCLATHLSAQSDIHSRALHPLASVCPGHSWRFPGSCRNGSVKFWNEVFQEWKIGVNVDLWIWLIKAIYIRY